MRIWRAGSSKTDIFYGWRVVAAVFVLATFGWGVGFYGPPIYLHTVHETRGWSLNVVSIAVTAHFLFGAIVVANLPKLYRNFGVSRVTKTGYVALAAGVAGWASAQEPWQLFAATLVSGVGWATMGAAAVNAIIAPWFVRTRPAALSSAYNGASIGGVVFSPLWVATIAMFGFAWATVAIGLVMVVTIWILADVYFAKEPEQMGLNPDGVAPLSRAAPSIERSCPNNQLWRDQRFITLAAGMTLGLFAQIGLLAHLFSVLVPALGEQLAGFAAGLATAAAVAGRTLVGWLMPAGADRRLFICGNCTLQILGSLAFLFAAGGNVPLLFLGIVLFGAGLGNNTSLPPLIAQTEFNKEDASRVVPLIVAMSQGIYAFAPAAFGFIRAVDIQWSSISGGGAPWMFICAALIQAASAAAYLIGRGQKNDVRGNGLKAKSPA
jgi:MFS family permease